jgi:formylglycine-generating enzyme required for sulfatase activity/cephalosporin-C deacetylase-like acetyl esterase
MIGKTISHYRIIEKLGGGGMGVVYRAEDIRLKRIVALKFLPPELTRDEEAKKRFIHEAQAASALQHRNICTIHEIDETPDGQMFICMDCYDGETLKQKIVRGRVPVREAVDIAVQTAEGLAKAHEAGMVHRDIKPANIIVTKEGEVKILDFGLAKLAGQTRVTRTGTTLGTVAYMSPEQAMGGVVDARSDIFSLGAILYEMLAGEVPFPGEHEAAILYGIVHSEPEPVARDRSDVPDELRRIVGRMLSKDVDARYGSARELVEDLESLRGADARRAGSGSPRRFIGWPKAVAIGLSVLLVAGGAIGWTIHKAARARWARETAIPGIVKLADADKYADAFALAGEAHRYVPNDAKLAELLSRISRHVRITTTPSGAELYYKAYLAPESKWIYFGRTPIDSLRLPLGGLRWKIEKEGYETLEAMGVNLHARPEGYTCSRFAFSLLEAGTGNPGMVRVPATNASVEGLPKPVPLPAFLIDRYEVTNWEFKRFVDGDGYRNRSYWKNEFVDEERVLSWDEAMALFRDKTGRPGPSTWSGGTYSVGQDSFPVGGVSWYEAAAFAEFAGKSLPTAYHWREAARVVGNEIPSLVVRLSNFSGAGCVPVGSTRAVGPYGTCDMAGNVKEWCGNARGELRCILGGAWDDPIYMYAYGDARSPLDRSATNGLRCIVSSGDYARTLRDSLPPQAAIRDYTRETPVPDGVFQAYAAQYAYDPKPLDARIESTDESSPYWRKEKVSFIAAYGNERVPAYLFLPKNARGPFQAVVFMPGASAWYPGSSENLRMVTLIDFVIMSGRAVLYPVYDGTYERYSEDGDASPLSRAYVDLLIRTVNDCRRSIDYLAVREDIDSDKIAYYGCSFGARIGSLVLALDNRPKIGVLASGGFSNYRKKPESDELNFAPRVSIPILMINGKYDLVFPQPLQKAIFDFLGTPADQKKHVLLEMGHGLSTEMRSQVTKEILDWLDLYFGPVR